MTALAVAAGGACTLLPWYQVPESAYSEGTVALDCCVRGGRTVEITYLGVGGFLFRSGDAAVLTGPLYSNPGLVEAGLQRIAAEPDVVREHIPDVADVTAILVGHGHYDHLMDVPPVMAEHAPRALLYANRTSFVQVQPFGFEERGLVAEERAAPSGSGAAGVARGVAPGGAGPPLRPGPGDGRVVVLSDSIAGDDETPGRWIDVGEGVRIMALRSDHAPHFAGVTLYSGERERPMSAPPASANQWLDGETYAFLIDLLAADGSTAIRIYYQDAVAAPPYGLVPPFAEGTVDVALIVPATYAEVHWHPEAILDDARPAHVILAHWENFFEAPDAEAEPVPFTLLSDFLRRLERALPDGVEYHVPRPGTVFVFR